MQTNKIPVCDIGFFNNTTDFWIESIDNLLVKYPFLEYPHENTFYTFLIVEKGYGEVIIDNSKIYVEDSQLFIIKPNCITQIYLNKEAVGKIICFTEDFFALRYNNNVLNQFSFFNTASKAVIRVNNDNMCYLNSLLLFMNNEFISKKKASKKALRSYLNILLIETERFYNPVSYNMDSNNPTKEKVQKFQKLIEKNFKTVKLPSDYAKILNVSTNYLNKICKKITGVTSGDLIRKHIVLEAQRLLHYTNYSINEIANELGFEHTSYFVTFFKKTTNQTPEQFRRKQTES